MFLPSRYRTHDVSVDNNCLLFNDDKKKKVTTAKPNNHEQNNYNSQKRKRSSEITRVDKFILSLIKWVKICNMILSPKTGL